MIDADTVWLSPPAHIALAEQDVHVWRAPLEQPASLIAHLQRFLHTDEVARAERFYFVRDRNHFIVARGLLRLLLGRYLDCAPETVSFCYNEYGKPALDYQPCRLHFNLSHSHDLVVYAFSLSRSLGIDIEYMRAEIAYEELAKHYFSPVEYATLQALPAASKGEAFYHCWTRKEAYIKARGKGLSLPLDVFDVSLQPGAPAALLESREDPREPGRWKLQALAPGAGYAGALAAEGQDWQYRCWQLSLQDKWSCCPSVSVEKREGGGV